MRAARLLQILLLLQNRGRMTSAQLSEELEVARRTILRDVDAMTEAGLPIIVHQGNRGGIELGFNYRTRLTGLAADEAEALAVILGCPVPALESLGMTQAANRARSKLLESFPDGVRVKVQRAQSRFRFARPDPQTESTGRSEDPRVEAFANAIRGARIVRIQARSGTPRKIHPEALVYSATGWQVIDALAPDQPIPVEQCGDINISAHCFRSS